MKKSRLSSFGESRLQKSKGKSLANCSSRKEQTWTCAKWVESQSWALSVFFTFLNIKKWFLWIFDKVTNLFLCQSYLKSPLLVKLTRQKMQKIIFYYWKNKKYRKCPALLFSAYFLPKMVPHPCYKLKHGTHWLFFRPHVYRFCLFSAHFPPIPSCQENGTKMLCNQDGKGHLSL